MAGVDVFVSHDTPACMVRPSMPSRSRTVWAAATTAATRGERPGSAGRS
jgi:hypothetical protein